MRTLVDVFLLPPDPPPASLAPVVKAVHRRLQAAQAVVVATTAWRPVEFEFFAPAGDIRAQELLSATLDEARERDLIAHPVAGAPSDDITGVLGEGQVLVGVARQSPERMASLGEALAAACGRGGRPGAVIAHGRLGRDPGEAGAAFDRSLLADLEQGADAVSGTDPEAWLAGRPDADLAHLFLILGASGPGARAQILGYDRSSGEGLAVLDIRPGEMSGHPLPARRFTIPVKEISRG